MSVSQAQAALRRHLARSPRSRMRVQLLEANATLGRALAGAVEAHRAKSAFLAGLSHQLRTPLSTILLGSELLGEDLKAQGLARLTPDLDRIQDAGRLLLAMLDDVIDLTRVEAGRMTYRREETDLRALAHKVAAACAPLAKRHETTLTVQVADPLRMLNTDPAKLGQILFHLLNNALKFTRNGQVTLDLSPDGADTVFQVIDTGIGMDPELVDGMTLDFDQDPKAHPAYGNAGLGLTLCRVLAQGLGGTLRVASSPQAGTTFTLRLLGSV